MEPALQEVLRQLLERRSLTEEQAQRAFEQVLSGAANESQVAAMLALMAVKGPSLDEAVGGARAMRAHMERVPLDGLTTADRESVIDTCGTGGAPKTFNISTAAAIVAAAARGAGGKRVRVAKHGGRSRSGRGSAEVLALLGVNVDASPQVQAKCLRDCGFCFSFAVNHHPAMKFAAGPRKSLGFPTVFNLLGPLCNPAGARRQLIGVYGAGLVELIAQALARLGTERAMVVHGRDGMDELTTTERTIVGRVQDGRVGMEEIDAKDLGIARASLDDLAVSSVEESAEVIRRVLAGEKGARRDIVLLNAAAALAVGGAADDLSSGIGAAASAIDSGAAKRALERLGAISRGEKDPHRE